MSKEINLEYTLKTRSKAAVWTLISTVVGLQKWLADDVRVENDKFVFVWGNPLREHEERSASIIDLRDKDFICLHWDDSPDNYYVKMKMIQNEIAENCHLEISEIVDDDEEEYVKSLWDKNLQQLYQITGL